MPRLIRNTLIILCISILATVTVGCTLFPTGELTPHLTSTDLISMNETPPPNRGEPPYQQPEWVSLFTTNPKVLAYRWYTANDCPSGGYSHQDDLYAFAPEEILSRIEISGLEEKITVIGVEGFHSTDGYICMALSEPKHPSNYTALHELAHAIVYTELGLTGHNKLFQEKLVEIALEFEESDCRTDDYRLRNLIAMNTPLFPMVPITIGKVRPAPTETPLFIFCYGKSTPKEIPATKNPLLLAAPENPPTPTPQIIPENRFVELKYDASSTLNNRQSPAQRSCSGGSKPATLWSRTLNVESSMAFIEDANHNKIQVIELNFALVHPGRRVSQNQCPNSKNHASATLMSTNTAVEPDLTGY